MTATYVLKVYEGKIIHEGIEKDLYTEVLTCEGISEVKRLKKIIEEDKNKKVVVKMKTKKGWTIIDNL